MKANDLLGNLPKNESPFVSRNRAHQAWWRSAVLNQPQGAWPGKPEASIGSSIVGGETSLANFWPIEADVREAVAKTLAARAVRPTGLFQTERFYNNLLSSQPMAFYAFSPLLTNPAIADQWLSQWLQVEARNSKVVFEFAPANHLDHSAFDVGIQFTANGAPAFLGLECKLTDQFSNKHDGMFYGLGDKNESPYRALFDAFPGQFAEPYEAMAGHEQRNQLFRGELLGLTMRQQTPGLQVWTGLFHHPDDANALSAGAAFAATIPAGTFRTLTYFEFVQQLQRLELPTNLREWTMYFWARYCALPLSAQVLDQAKQPA